MLQILPDLTLLIQIVLFLVFIGVMNRLLFRPALAVLEERDRQIAGSRDTAAELETRVSEAIASYEVRLREARSEGERERTRLTQEAAQEEARIGAEGRAQAAQATEKIRAAIARETQVASGELEGQVRQFAAMIAERALGRRVT